MLILLSLLDFDQVSQFARRLYYGSRGAAYNLVEPSGPKSYAEASQCRENLRAIERAKRVVAERKGQVAGFITVQEVEQAMGHPLPRCPSGGTYTLQALVELPTCSIDGNGTLEPRDDHIIRKF